MVRWSTALRLRNPVDDGEGSTLAQALDDVRADQVGERQGQSPPQLDEQAVPRVERVQFGHALASDQQVLVVKRLRLEAPVLLEVEGASAAFTTAVVEHS